MRKRDIFKEGIIAKNPIFVLLLGMCSSLAITTCIDNAIGMGIAVTLVLICSNLLISLLRKFIPDEVRLPIFIIIIATFVSCITMFVEAYAYDLYVALGVFLPLITVNCIVLGRAEAFASKNNPLHSMLDGLANGIGYTLALLIISFCRELLGTGNIVLHDTFGIFTTQGEEILNVMGIFIKDSEKLSDFTSSISIPLFTTSVGAFITLGLLIAIFNQISMKKKEKKELKDKEVIENA